MAVFVQSCSDIESCADVEFFLPALQQGERRTCGLHTSLPFRRPLPSHTHMISGSAVRISKHHLSTCILEMNHRNPVPMQTLNQATLELSNKSKTCGPDAEPAKCLIGEEPMWPVSCVTIVWFMLCFQIVFFSPNKTCYSLVRERALGGGRVQAKRSTCFHIALTTSNNRKYKVFAAVHRNQACKQQRR